MAGKFAKGLVRDTHDSRDLKYVNLEPKLAAAQGWVASLPPEVDLRRTVSPVRNQGHIGACTGFAIAVGLAEALDLGLTNQQNFLSPLFIYYMERELEGTVGQDVGASIRTGMKVLATYGVCSEAIWPYNPANLDVRPSDQAMSNATAHKISNYYRIDNFSQLHRTLAYRNPVVMGIQVYESFETDAAAKTGIIPVPNINMEQPLGGHAVIATGYNDIKQVVIVKNSWGDTWGDKGFFYLPYKYFDPSLSLVWDMWTAQY